MKSIILLSIILVAACAMLLTESASAANGDRDQTKDQIRDKTQDKSCDCTPDCLQDQTRLLTKLQIRDCP
jgi:Ni/Co efflux regulator RcnB